MNKLFDLRFVIGAFFTIIGFILIVYAFTSAAEDIRAINRGCGIGFVVFGGFMLILSFQKDENDEVLNDDIETLDDVKKIN